MVYIYIYGVVYIGEYAYVNKEINVYISIYPYTHGIATKTPLGHPCVLITDGYESTIIY